jgi:hypothetical protein
MANERSELVDPAYNVLQWSGVQPAQTVTAGCDEL